MGSPCLDISSLLSAVYRIIETIFTPYLYVRNYYKLLMMGLSKACDCLPYDFLLVKIAACGFDNTASALITDYFKNSNLQTFYLNW